MDTYLDPKTGKKWRKVLFERGNFPDNYTPDKCFLAAIRRNKNLHRYTFLQCVLGASQVSIFELVRAQFNSYSNTGCVASLCRHSVCSRLYFTR